MSAATRRRGFTLVELLAVVALLLLLASILFPLARHARLRALRLVDLTNLRQFVAAVMITTTENEGMLPISTREGTVTCGYCDDMAWFRHATYTNIQNYVCDSDRKVFACTSVQRFDPRGFELIGLPRDCSGAYHQSLRPERVNGTHVGWNYYAGRALANCTGGRQAAYDPQGNLITNDYQFPFRTGDNPTSRTLVTCPNWVSGSSWWDGSLRHLHPDDGVRRAPVGYPLWGAPDFIGMHCGYSDGSARWVKPEDLGVFKDVNWMYFDRTR